MARASTRKTLAEQIRANTLASRFYARMSIKPVALPEVPDLPAPRAKAVPSGKPLETDIQAEIIAMLRKHPKVAIVERHNSGTAVEQNRDGEKRYVRFNTVFKVGGVRMRKSDIDCTLTNGKRFVVEVKRPPWKGPTDQRETEQENYIKHVRASTGYGMFAVSVAQVAGALELIKVD